MAILVPTPIVCEDFSPRNLKIPDLALDSADSC